MAVFKCKSCGAPLDIKDNQSVVTCEYCGLQQTLPKLDDDRRANLYDRANHFRRNNDYDKAMSIYEQILNEDKHDAEAYWSLVLCRYGIEYVEDPATRKRIPTVNRAQYTSVVADEDYKSALENADAAQRQVYIAEAKQIDEIQKGILAISQKEKPFDVFICYKETDANGRRTPDSVLANDLYHQLTQEGFKVFFARITLEDKLGSAYEPYIFAALNSAKVMVALGTKSEYFNAVWVKNEWSRYLKLIRAGAKKVLIPAYRDMDPYDLPEEFSHLQAQDMSKLGFMQDLIRGIKKLTASEKPAPVKETVVVQNAPAGSANTAALLERAFMFLEDEKWKDADDYCEKVLDIEPKNAKAYLGKLMASLRVSEQKELKNCADPFDDDENYEKIMRFGDDALKRELEGAVSYIEQRNEQARLTSAYNRAVSAMNAAKTESDYKDAADSFAAIRSFKDADAMEKKCRVAAETCRKDKIYNDAISKVKRNDSVSAYEAAIQALTPISDWKDSAKLIEKYQSRIEEIQENERQRIEREQREAQERAAAAEAAAKKRKKTVTIVVISVVIIAALVAGYMFVLKPMLAYSNAEKLMENGKYAEASAAFKELGDYKDAADRVLEPYYVQGEALLAAGDYDGATKAFTDAGEYSDASTQALAAQYAEGEALLAAGDYDGATEAFEDAGSYSDASTQALAAQYAEGEALLAAGDYDGATQAFTDAGSYSDASTQIMECRYQKAGGLLAEGKYDEAAAIYITLSGYKDVDKLIEGDENLSAAAAAAAAAHAAYIAQFDVGNTVTFGSYAGEDIEWLVLEANGDERIMISVKGLDAVQFNKSASDGNKWETSYVRDWLNGTFYNAAFTAEEQAQLSEGVTGDKVYLLSVDEAEAYFKNDDARICKPTQHAKDNGAYVNSDTGGCWWWLRSPGYNSDYAAHVSTDGRVYAGGFRVNVENGCVRPVVSLRLS